MSARSERTRGERSATLAGVVATPSFGERMENLASRAVREWGLTRRQLDVVRLMAQGEANKAIAGKLGCAERTVEVHVTAVLRKARVASRAELIARFWTQL